MSMSRKPLSVFQHNILHVVADLKTPYGLGIKRALDGDYDWEINTGWGCTGMVKHWLRKRILKNQRSTNKLFTQTQIQ